MAQKYWPLTRRERDLATSEFIRQSAITAAFLKIEITYEHRIDIEETVISLDDVYNYVKDLLDSPEITRNYLLYAMEVWVSTRWAVEEDQLDDNYSIH